MFTAVPAVAFLAWQLVPRTIFGLDGWRWVVIIGSVGAFVIWWIRRNLPESPRWLEHHGRTAEADAIVSELERRITADGAVLPPPEPVGGESERKTGAWSEMWNANYRGRTIMLVIYNLFQTIGYYGFSSWVPTLLISQGVEVTKSLTYTFIIAVAAPIGPLIGVFFADRFERKWQIAWAAAGIAVFGLLFAQQNSAAGVIVCRSRSMPTRRSFIQLAFAPRRSASSIRGAGFRRSSPVSSSRSFSEVTARWACSALSPARWRSCLS
jgi:putative MFS transporter